MTVHLSNPWCGGGGDGNGDGVGAGDGAMLLVLDC